MDRVAAPGAAVGIACEPFRARSASRPDASAFVTVMESTSALSDVLRDTLFTEQDT